MSLDPLVGKTIAERYEIVSLISAGGMGAVYRAKQHALDRDVAVKFMHPTWGGPGAAKRFMAEAHAASRLNHPHVVSVFDFGRTSVADGGLLFLVMELLSGVDLEQLMSQLGPLPLSRVVPIVSQTLQALAEAHDHGIVHRDVKPANILLTHTRAGVDRVKVIDFGIAREGSRPRITEAGIACGTAEYIAPEQVKGDPIGPTADLYSMGVVLFEMLTGALPFDHPTQAATLAAHVSAPRPAPDLVAPHLGIPRAVAEVCRRAMSVRPEDRFPSAESFEAALVEAARDVVSAPRSALRRARETLPFPLVAKARPASAPPRRDVPLLGRDADLAWVRERLSQPGGPSWLEITGPTGIGRSEMLRAVAEVADELGHAVVAVPVEPAPFREISHRGLRRILPWLAGVPVVELSKEVGLAPIERRALEGLRVVFQHATTRCSHPDGTRSVVAAALAWAAQRAVLRSPSGRATLLLDDVDRLDAASLNALLDQQATEPIAGFSIVSSSELAIPASSEGRASRELRGLSHAEAVRVLEASDADAFLAPSHDDIEPLYVEQARLAKPNSGFGLPPTLAGLVEWRLQILPPAQRSALLAVAIAGAVTEAELERLAPPESGGGGAELPSLIEAGLLVIRDKRILLSHALVGRLAVARAPGAAIAEIHARAAETLTGPAFLELRAYHAIRGDADFAAFLDMEAVATLRSRHGDAEGAIAALSQAVTTARDHIVRGDSGTGSAALGVFGRKLAAAHIVEGRLDEARGALIEILSVCGSADMARAAVLEMLASVAHLEGDAEEARRRWTDALGIASSCGDANAIERLRAFLRAGVFPEKRRALRPAEPTRARRPVLVVDDDRSIRETMLSVLTSDGRHAFGAANGEEALATLRRIPRPGLILLDLMMPGMTGWHLLDLLRSDDAFSDIPVVVVSAVAKRDEKGAARVIQKPMQIGTLLDVVQEFCG